MELFLMLKQYLGKRKKKKREVALNLVLSTSEGRREQKSNVDFAPVCCFFKKNVYQLIFVPALTYA